MTEAMEGAETRLSFYVNGREVGRTLHVCLAGSVECRSPLAQVHVDRPDPEMTLLYFLRNNRIPRPPGPRPPAPGPRPQRSRNLQPL